jgi:polyisoprenoid-binding protein YceI
MKPTSLAAIAVLSSAALIAACSHGPKSQTTSVAAVAPAAWQVDPALSQLSFVTVKAGQPGVGGISEVQSFSGFGGGMDTKGQVNFSVSLATVATGIDIRDERLRTMLFNVKATPSATFTAQVEPAPIRALAAGASSDVEVNGQLTLVGQAKPVAAKLRVTRLSANKLLVVTRAPIVIDAQQFGLKAGVEALRESVGLGFLASSAPVTFSLVLHDKG